MFWEFEVRIQNGVFIYYGAIKNVCWIVNLSVQNSYSILVLNTALTASKDFPPSKFSWSLFLFGFITWFYSFILIIPPFKRRISSFIP